MRKPQIYSVLRPRLSPRRRRFRTRARCRPSSGLPRRPAGVSAELALRHDALMAVGHALDPVLVTEAFGRQQPHDLVGAARRRTVERAGTKLQRLADAKFMVLH